jgi:urease accessory protein
MKRLLWLLALVTCVCVPSAHAHLMNTGFGPFYDGLTHLFVSPEDLLPVIALALLAGLCGPASGRWALFVAPVAWIAGSLVRVPLSVPAVTALVTIALGVLVAAGRPLPVRLIIGCAALLGLIHGNLNGPDLIGSGIVGVAVALFVVVALLAGQVSALRSVWARIVVRVAGSWIAASGLFMLGWAARAAR